MAKRSETKAEPAKSDDEYDAFEKLTKDLLAVSKKRLDDARAREQAKKD